MAFRFARSFRLGKLFRLNLSKSGLGISFGIKGLRLGTGPRGKRVTASLPGTGLRYQKELDRQGRRKQRRSTSNTPAETGGNPPPIPAPGFFAPGEEKAFVKGLNLYRAGQPEAALPHFLEAAPREASAALFAAAIYATQDGKAAEAIRLLEELIRNDAPLPTPLTEKYLATATIQIGITRHVTATVPMNGLAAVLILVELYQGQDRTEEAIGLLEEVEAIAREPALTLSLCELYAERNLWDGIVERGQGVESEDNVTLEILILYGRAMQEKGLHEAAKDVFNKAVRRKKDRDPLLLREANYLRARAYEALGNRRQVNKILQRIYAEDPGYRDVAERLAV